MQSEPASLAFVVCLAFTTPLLSCSSSGGTTADAQDMHAAGSDLGAPARDLAVAPDLAGDPSACAPTGLSSACGREQSIVRSLIRLGDGMPDSAGEVVVNLNHYRLGGGASGGVAHWGTTASAATVRAATPLQADLDMCAGGDMWSEENCEFWLWAFVDKNGNAGLDAGEPAGHALVTLSCRAAGAACVPLVLDCLDGISCVAFNDPAACRCKSPGCGSSLVTCQ